MTSADSFTPNAEQAQTITNLLRAMVALGDVSITSSVYAPALAQAKEALKDAGRIHRNWNEDTGEPDGLYEEEEDQPAGARHPKVAHEDLTSFEATLEGLIYFFISSRPDAPTLTSALHFNKALNEVAKLVTYHPNYDPDRGVITG